MAKTIFNLLNYDLITFLTILSIPIQIQANIYHEICPQMCLCDTFNDLNRAICSGQKLINAHIDMPKIVEILDLSNNDITTLDDTCFSEFKQLVVLSLANNSINTIELDAFGKLRQLEQLILSNNRIELFDRRIIEMAHSLVSLKLDGNKFMNLPNESLLKSHSLQKLDLHNTHLTHVFPTLFQNIPQLESLDLSNNLLITLNKDAFKHNKKLKALNLTGNPWNCDGNLEATLRWMKKRHINVTITGCAIRKLSKPMFERMQMDPNLTQPVTTTIQPPTTIDIQKVWRTNKTISLITEQLICPLNNSELACDLYEACLANFTSFFHELEHKYDHMNAKNNQSNYKILWHNSNRLKDLEFVIGLFVGILLGATTMYVSAIIAKCCQSSIKRHSGTRRQSAVGVGEASTNFTATEYSNIPTFIESSVQAPNRPIRRQRNRHTLMAQQQTPNEPTQSFLASLFQRRRRYTTNLVRRLSQSRLFLARQNSSNINNDSIMRQYRELDTQRLIDSVDNSQYNSTFSITGQRLATSASTPPETQLNSQICNIEQSEEFSRVEINRAETPPPAYKDIVTRNTTEILR